ncbi:MAG TPA: response regulator, partial [Phenylobacterium sp.]|nr:response regulator [Phenylobacterium sp.]
MDEARRLLIVEDDARFAATLQRSFERRGYQVALAADAGEVERRLAAASPQFAVVDLKLGAGSGLVCVQRLHAHDP